MVRWRGAFTFVELLVVIALLVVLQALLVPAMERAVEHARRAVCAARIHNFITASVSYASEHRGTLPSGVRNGFGEFQFDAQGSLRDRTEHVVWVPSDLMAVARQYGGSPIVGRGETNPVLTCPNFHPEFGYYDRESDNYVIGYSWLGGLKQLPKYNQELDPNSLPQPPAPPSSPDPNNPTASPPPPSPSKWQSPRKLSDKADDIMADHNAWTVAGGGWMFIAHTYGGPLGGPDAANPDVNYFNYGSGGPEAHPAAALFASEGGMVGRSDGMVRWKELHEMRVYESSWPYTGYPAMW